MRTYWKLKLLCVLSGLWTAVSMPTAMAGGPPFEPIDAETLIQPCWAISEEKRASGVTALMRKGTLETVLCLERVILDQVEILFPDGKYLSRAQAQEKLKRLRFAYGSLYWFIYNEHQGCDPSCGTMKYVFHLAENAALLEKMIRDMMEQRNQYEINGPERP